MSSKSLIQKSKQSWKLFVGFAGVFVGFSAMVYGLNRLEDSLAMSLTLGGMALDLVAFVSMCVSIRCRACGMRWLWAAVKNQEQLQWVNWLRAQHVCPRCGYDPSVKNPLPP